jgi:OmpA-OmpF porin, OOP family
MKLASHLISTLLLALAGGVAMAQEVRVYGADEVVDPQEVARILGAEPAPAIKMRGLKLLDDDTAAPAQRASAAGRRSALSLPVQFALDSADLQPAARPQLDALAAGIRKLPADKAVVIEGHADARGTDSYNEALSQKRAASVKRYLVATTGIDPQRLHVIGRGKNDPLPGRDPMAPENRRVQFRGE